MKARATAAAVAACCSSVSDASIVWHQGIIDDCQLWYGACQIAAVISLSEVRAQSGPPVRGRVWFEKV
eukprot:scaffold28191_cov67-Skeletonema_dohrnii-CCMP3373.AAC.2